MKKIIITAIVTAVICISGTVYAVTVMGKDISYDNTNSGLTSTDVQGAIDELTEKAASGEVLYYKGVSELIATNGYYGDVKYTNVMKKPKIITVSFYHATRGWTGIYDLDEDNLLVQARTYTNQEGSITNVRYDEETHTLYCTLYLYGATPSVFTSESATLMTF